MTDKVFTERLKKVFFGNWYDTDDAVSNALEKLHCLYKTGRKHLIAEYVLGEYEIRSLKSKIDMLEGDKKAIFADNKWYKNQHDLLSNSLDGLRVILARLTAPQLKSSDKDKRTIIPLSEILVPPKVEKSYD